MLCGAMSIPLHHISVMVLVVVVKIQIDMSSLMLYVRAPVTSNNNTVTLRISNVASATYSHH